MDRVALSHLLGADIRHCAAVNGGAAPLYLGNKWGWMLAFGVRLCVGVCWLTIAFLGVTPSASAAPQVPVAERLVSIDLKDQSLLQVLNAVTGQLGVVANLCGQEPEAKRDVLLSNVSLRMAVTQILRLYGVHSHVAAFNTENNTMVLTLLRSFPAADVLTPGTQAAARARPFDDEFLSPQQMNRLLAQSAVIETEMEEDALPLTPYQMDRLRKRSAEVEAEMIPDSTDALTPWQLEQLEIRSQAIEMEFLTDQPLAAEQVLQLKERSNQIEAEQSIADQPLTADQLQRLRERSDQIKGSYY